MKNITTKTWERIYKDWFQLEKNFSNIQVPEYYNQEKHFNVIVAREMATNKIIVDIRKQFDIYVGFDDAINDRNPESGDYIILFNRSIEPDKLPSFASTAALDQIQHKGITLLERILLEVLYFDVTKKHLDIENTTNCNGSRDNLGRVPGVSWDKTCEKLIVLPYSPRYYKGSFRARAVID
ncbi:MAG TPA: hypothetical protein PK526_04075 [bacterium]|nr:hypothetical protein [bacterium]